MREPYYGRMWGIWNVEGDDDPVALFPYEYDAKRELERRQGLPEDHDDHLGEYHHVFPGDIVMMWWNSHDPDPRDENPLSPREIFAEYDR